MCIIMFYCHIVFIAYPSLHSVTSRVTVSITGSVSVRIHRFFCTLHAHICKPTRMYKHMHITPTYTHAQQKQHTTHNTPPHTTHTTCNTPHPHTTYHTPHTTHHIPHTTYHTTHTTQHTICNISRTTHHTPHAMHHTPHTTHTHATHRT